jgi:hypothetical protein
MSRKSKAIEKNEWDGKSAFEQFQLASSGATKLDSKLATLVNRLDHVTDKERKGEVIGDEKIAWEIYKKKFGEQLMELWWNTKHSKNGEAFRQLAWMAEQKVAVHPDYQLVAWLKQQFELGKLPALPVTAIVKFYDDHWRQHPITGLPKTNYRQMDRICKKLKYSAPKAKRGPKVGTRRKPSPRNY